MKTILKALSEVSDALRGEYEQRGDVFVLKLEGDVHPAVEEANTKVAEFRDTNIGLKRERDELVLKLKNFDGLDPAEVKRNKERLAELESKGGIKEPKDIDAKIRMAVEEGQKGLKAELEQLKGEKQQTETQLKRKTLETTLQQIGAKVGVEERAMPDFIQRGVSTFNLEGLAMKGDTQLFSKAKPSEPLSMEEWALGLQTEAPHLFKQSTGGGGKGGNHAGKRVIAGGDPLVFGNNLEDIAKGNVVVQ